jgi:mycothiol system anti-sigma-R factor
MAERPNPETTADCREALAELYTYLDGEVGAVERSAVEAHLDRCSDCLEAFEFHHELRRLIAETCQRDVPDHLRARILDALARPGEDRD